MKKITKKDIKRSIRFMQGKRLTTEQRIKMIHFWIYGTKN